MARCKICQSEFTKRSMTHKVCGTDCSLIFAKQERERRERKQDKVRKEKLKSRSDYIKEAQIAFNTYIRERDRAKGCVSCGASLRLEGIGGGYDCGHYRSIGSAPHLRFDERNAAGQCKKCNRYGAGRPVDYRIVLRRRIGLEALELLESDQTPRHFTIEELKAIKQEYKEKLKNLGKCVE